MTILYLVFKVLYPTLDLVLTDNPFSRVPSDDKATMNDTLKSLSMIHEMCEGVLLNQGISQQLFSYLYFFVGTSLANKMFDKGM